MEHMTADLATRELGMAAEELAVLQDEVERLRLRTFPSFVERTDTVRLPDIHARPTGRRQY